METLTDAPVLRVRQRRPRMRSVGVAQLVAGVALVGALAFASFEGCGGAVADPIPGGLGLALLVVVAGAAMAGRLPRGSAVAPAMSMGAAITLLGGAMAGWWWVTSQTCVDNVLDQAVVSLLIVTAASIAVIATSLWLLTVRREIEPWFGSVGVGASATAALALVVLGLTFGMVLPPGAGTVRTLSLVLPWAVTVAAAGWLRRSPAIAMVTPAVCQTIWLLIR